MDEKKISNLLELGASRATAIRQVEPCPRHETKANGRCLPQCFTSALKAAKWDTNEAAVLIWDDKHMNAKDEGSAPDVVASSSKGKGRVEPMQSDSDDGGEDIDEDEDDYGFAEEDEEAAAGDEFFQDDDEDVAEVGADPFAQISFQKDRKVTVIEVEEIPERATITVDGKEEDVLIMPQGEWMKGCPEGTEQSVRRRSAAFSQHG